MKHVIVCAKQVMDPEAPSGSFEIDATHLQITPAPNVAQVISPFDEHALEAALRIKEADGSRITVLSLGNDLQRDVIKKSLAMGADELILLEDPAFVNGDAWSTAYALYCAIKKIGSYDLILCGRQASDFDSGTVGIGIAEFLGIPSVTLAKSIECINGKARIERVIEDGFEELEVSLPALVTVSNEIGEPRYPKIRGMMIAKKIEPIIWKPSDLELSPNDVGAAACKSQMIQLFERVQEGKCEFVEGETPEEMGINLAIRLKQNKIL